MISDRFELRSSTISAPVRVSESCSAASQMARQAFCHLARSEGSSLRFLNRVAAHLSVRPICSSARRSSGWNSTISAKKPICSTLCMIHTTVRRFIRFASAYTTSTTTAPLASWAARVLRITTRISYTTKATSKISTKFMGFCWMLWKLFHILFSMSFSNKDANQKPSRLGAALAGQFGRRPRRRGIGKTHNF